MWAAPDELLLIAYELLLPFNANAGVFGRARCLSYGMSLHLLPFFVNAFNIHPYDQSITFKVLVKQTHHKCLGRILPARLGPGLPKSK